MSLRKWLKDADYVFWLGAGGLRIVSRKGTLHACMRNGKAVDQMHFLMTVDVESFSIPLNREDSEIAEQIYEVGLPRLLDLLSKPDVQSTFYFTGTFAEQSPESVEFVKEQGHEIGCHGYDHSPQRAFDYLQTSSGIS